MMLHQAKGRAVTADDIRNLVVVFDVPGKSGFYKVQHRNRLPILTKLTSKHRYPRVWVSKSAFGTAPLTFGLAADFPADYDIESSELATVVGAVPDSRRQGLLFKSSDLMATTGWFVPIDEDPLCSGPGAEAVEDPESEAGGSSAPLPDAGGNNHIRAFVILLFSTVYAYCYVLTD